jgi:hypothetical protein
MSSCVCRPPPTHTQWVAAQEEWRQEPRRLVSGYLGRTPQLRWPRYGRLYEAREEDPIPTAPEPLSERLRSGLYYWFAAMRDLGTVCVLTLSIIDADYALEWAPDNLKGPLAVATLPNTRHSFANRDFVSVAIAEGVAAGTMVPCSAADLHCVLPLSVAFNSGGKHRLIWD